MSQRRIRFAGPDDAETIHAFIVGLAVYEKEPDAVEVSPAQLAAQLGEPRPPFECLLQEENDVALGMALFFQSYSTWRGHPGLYLEDLFVPDEHRRKGVGEELMRYLARLAVERGCARLGWAVLDWNEPAIEFYRVLGAQPESGWTIWRLDGDALARIATVASEES